MTEQHEQPPSDFSFFLGEVVNVGTNKGTIVGQSTFATKQDRFLVAFPMDDDGLPFERWFDEYQIDHTLKN